MVPPVPTPEMRMSTWPSVSSQISGPVVLKWISRIGGIVELLEHVAVGRFGEDLLGLGDGAVHAVGARGEDNFGAESKKQHAALEAHGLGHGEDELVALHRGDESQTDAGIAAGGLDEDGFAGVNFSLLLGGFDHGEADAVFHAVDGVSAFELGDNASVGAGGDAIKLHERGIADEFSNAAGDFHG